ncbi:pca operon transcription factor PcaQ [Phaeobacter porticola]|uniref:Putative HTH-type transcriptional regulator pcaQ n=1 Tax=Phaeobacter porticola TaxID=1844006 RepID=A0A1L3I0J7_9RHOB|nr:pca operon transcription factor PcaQ [Phaeobacter porticola]APG45653.1 putative HTH-type transcriptional regulator pcaQ [Phaeobacter porticola]
MRLSSQLKLRHLEVFVEVARKMSVTQAAERLGMTQPAVTRALRELEAVCDKPLVEKYGRGIRLSPYGEMFRDYAGRSLALTRDGVEMLRGLDAAEGSKVAIGALPTVSATVVPDALARIWEQGGRNRFSVVSGDNQHLLDLLRRGELDVVVGRLPAPKSMVGLDFDPLFREHVTVVVAPDHPLTALSAEALPEALFGTYPVLMPPPASIIRSSVERMFLEQGIQMPLAAIETVSSTFGRQFALAHQAVWIISHGVVRSDLANGALVALPLDTDSTLGPVGLCLRSEHQLSPAAARFCAALKRICT